MEIASLIACTSLTQCLDNLSKIGGFLGGIAGILVLFIGNKKFNDYWRIKKSNAASAILSKFRTCIDDIADITLYKDLYKYPSHPQELSTGQKENVHPERPARLIHTKIQQLRKELHDPISQLAGKEGTHLLDLLSKLQAYASQISSAVYVSINADEGCAAAKEQLKPIKHYLDECQAILKKFTSEVELFLIPIIEIDRN